MDKVEFTKRDKELYLPKAEPTELTVPPILFLMVDGQGNPNEADGEYQAALGALYALSYTIKMSPKNGKALPDYYEYSVAPLEGLWDTAKGGPLDYAHKEGLRWTAMIRQPEFVTPETFEWAKAEAARKKKIDCSSARLAVYDEGLCVQCMHTGSYDDEPATVERLHAFLAERGLRLDMDGARRHHEIYLRDPRRTAPEKLKTVLRLPVAR